SLNLDVFKALSENDGWKEVAAFAKENFSLFKVFSVNATSVHNNGGNAVHDIAYALSVGNEFLHSSVEAGFAPLEANNMLQFNFTTDGSYFIEIAKYRVFRNLWNTVVRQYSSDKNITS